MQNRLLDRLQDFNQQRPSLPGEHWLTLGAGVLMLTRSNDSLLGGLLSKALGATLVWRALQGPRGLLALARNERPGTAAQGSRSWQGWMDEGAGSTGRNELPQPASEPARGDGYVEVAATWPYEERVRVAPSDENEASDASVRGGALPSAH